MAEGELRTRGGGSRGRLSPSGGRGRVPRPRSHPRPRVPSGSGGIVDQSALCTKEQTRAWIRRHLQEDSDSRLPKRDIYDALESYCNNLGWRSLTRANFEKNLRQGFPNITTQHLEG